MSLEKKTSYLAHRNVTGKPEGSFSTLNVPMQNWMQNSHAAITEHKSGRGVTRDAFWTMCPIHKGWGQRGEALLGVHKKCLALNTQTRATPPQPLTGVCYSGQQTGNEIPQKLEGRHSPVRGQAGPVPRCLNSAGLQQCPCLRGFPLCCCLPELFLSTEGQGSSSCSPS